MLAQIWSELVQLSDQQQQPSSPLQTQHSLGRQSTNQHNESAIQKQVPILVHQPATENLGDGSTETAATIIICEPPLEPLNTEWHQTIQSEIMERIRDLQREHHKRSLQHLLNQTNNANQPGITTATTTNSNHQSSSTPPAVPPKPKIGIFANTNQNLYDTVADAMDDGVPAPTPTYHRPFDLPDVQSTPANLDSQRNEIEGWLMSMEKRFGDFVAEYNHVYLQRRKSSLTRGNNRQQQYNSNSSSNLESMTTETSLKKQLTIISVIIW